MAPDMTKGGILKNVNIDLGLKKLTASLRAKIKFYKKRAQEIENYLLKKPEEWGKFQNEFNSEVNGIFRDIMNFEKVNLANGNENKVYKLRRLFRNRIREIFVRGEYNTWSLYKPFGYAGDFKIIDDIYQNNPSTTGFDRLFDNYFQMLAMSVAVRNRKENFKRLIVNFINDRKDYPLKIMNLGSGSCRELKEICSSNILLNKDVIFDCYDNDGKSIKFAKNLVGDLLNINFINKNVLRFAATKEINLMVRRKYDLIYAMGLFDYLNDKISSRLIQNLRKLLKINGILAVSNVRDKYSNPTFHFMEWAGEWFLFYRDDDEFRKIFIRSGFKENKLKVQYEQQGILQYIIASNK